MLNLNGNHMSIDYKCSLLKTIQALNSFIIRRKYSSTANSSKLLISTPVGEEIEIYTAEEAEMYKQKLESILEFERLYSK